MDGDSLRFIFEAICRSNGQDPDDVLTEFHAAKPTIAPAEIDIAIVDDWTTVGLVPVSPSIEDAIMYLDCDIMVRHISPN